MCATPDGKHVATGPDDKTARLWSPEDGTLHCELAVHTRGELGALMPDGKHVATGPYYKMTSVWSLEDGKLQAYRSHQVSEHGVRDAGRRAHGDGIVGRHGARVVARRRQPQGRYHSCSCMSADVPVHL